MYSPDYTPSKDLLNDRVILVTGAGAGIGRALSHALAAHGATVVLLGRTVRKLEAVYDEIQAAGGPQPAIYPMDLLGATADHYTELAASVGAELGHLNGLVHNAGLLGTPSPIEHYDLEAWARVMQVNVNAAFLMTRACLPMLKSAPDASIVLTSSGVGRKGRAYWGAYAVSKFANEGFMQVLADEMDGSSVRVNCVNPGGVRTLMRAQAYPAEDPATLPTPDQVVGPYLYLLGPDAADVNGASVDAQPK